MTPDSEDEQGAVSQQEIDRLLARFYSGNPGGRRHSIRELGKCGPAGVRQLVKILGDTNDCSDNTRALAADELGRMGVVAVPALLRALENSVTRNLATNALGNIGLPAIPALKGALTHHSERVREAAATALLNMGIPESLEPLQQMLLDEVDEQHKALRTRKRRRFFRVMAIIGYFLFVFWAFPDSSKKGEPDKGLPDALRVFVHGPMYLMIFCFMAWEVTSSRRRLGAKAALSSDDIRLCGPLALLLIERDEQAKMTAATALKRLLLGVKASDARYFPPEIQSALISGIRRSDEQLSLIILRALEQIGDETAIPAVEKISRDEWSRYTSDIRNAAKECLPALYERSAAIKQSAVLLRPSINPFNSDSDLLVRSAESTELNPEQLLRPGNV